MKSKHFLFASLWLSALMVSPPSAALAHDFKVGFLVPLSGAEASAGKQQINGFKLAASERDGHADEEADGHLGGLDVYLLLIDTNGGREAALAPIRALIEMRGIQFVTGRIPSEWLQDIRKLLQQSPTILIEPGRLSALETRTMDGALLERAYAEKFGKPPDPAARMGYSLARLLDKAVRITGDDFSDPARVSAALDRAGYR